MAKKKRYKNVTIHPAQGGQLVGSASDDIPLSQANNFLTSSANYTQKINFRRETDGELRREGWELFAPTGEDDALKSNEPIRGLYQFTGTTGTPTFLAIAGNKLYKLATGDRRYAIVPEDTLNANPVVEYATVDGQDDPDPTQVTISGSPYGLIGNPTRGADYFDNDADDFTWSEIYTFDHNMDAKDADGTYKDPFEGGAYRWEFAEIRNHVIINNGIDLPVVCKSEWDRAVPLYGLRENGIISVGTISAYQDRLFCGDLTVFSTGYEDWFTYAENPYGGIYPSEGQTVSDLWHDGVERELSSQRYQYRIIYSAEGDPKLFNTGIVDSATGGFIAEGGGLPGKITITDGVYNFTPTYTRWSEKGVGVDGSMYQPYEFGSFGGDEHIGVFLTSPQSGEKLVDEGYIQGDLNAAIQALIRQYPERSLPYMESYVEVYNEFAVSESRSVQIGDIVTFRKNFAISGVSISTGDRATVYGFEATHSYNDESYTTAPKARMTDGTEIILPMNNTGSGLYPTYWIFSTISIPGPVINIDGNEYNTYGFSASEIIAKLIATITTLSGLFFKKESATNYRLVNESEENIKFLDENGNALTEGIEYNCVIRPYAEQIKRPAAIQEFVQDGSRILKMKPLSDKLVVYRDTGFYFVTQANSNINPFAIDPRYQGGRVPDYRHTIIDLGGNQHLFMGNSGVYLINRSSVEPKPMEVFELGPPFWHIVPPELSEFVYATDNPLTREIFINCPLGYKVNGSGEYINELGERTNIPVLDWGVIAYDYIAQTLSQIDQSFTASTTIRKPKYNRVGPEESWFIMAVHQSWDASSSYVGSDYRDDENYGGSICRYGYGPPTRGTTTPYRLYDRIGYGYTSKIKSGLIDFGDSFSDKEVRSYVLELSSKYGTTPIKVKISTNTAPQGSEVVETLSDGNNFVVLNDVVDSNMIPLYVRAPYMRDQIIVEPEYIQNGYANYGYIKSKIKDRENVYYWDDARPTVIPNPMKLVGRTFEVYGVDTKSTTQTINQG